MTQMLRDSLRDLAEDARVATPLPDTWAHAQRSRRRRLAAGVAAGTAGVLTVVVAAVGMVAPTLRQGSDSAGQPDDSGTLAVPTDISAPSPWETDTADAGPLGPLAVLGEDLDRHTSWFHTSDAFYGISAADGTYRYLDLPDLDTASTPVLSPGGSHIAYWIDVRSGSSGDPRLADGYAVYNATTGGTAMHLVGAAGGILPRLLLWSPGSDQLLAAYSVGPPDDRSAQVGKSEMLDVATNSATPLALGSLDRHADNNASWGPAGIAFWRPPKLTVVNPQTGAVDQSDVSAQHARYSRDLAWSPDGSRLAVTATFRDPGGPFLQVNSVGVLAAPRPGSASGGVERVSPFDAVYELLGWRDETHVLVVGVPTEEQAERSDSVPGVYSVDVATGDYDRLASVALPDTAWIRGIATSIAARPFADRPGPAGHPDPRAVWARVAALLFIAVMAVIVIVQSRRARDPARPLADEPR